MKNNINYIPNFFLLIISVFCISMPSATAQKVKPGAAPANTEWQRYYDKNVPRNKERLPENTKIIDRWRYPHRVFNVRDEKMSSSFVGHNCGGFNLVFLDEDNGSGTSSNLGFADPGIVTLPAGHPMGVFTTTLGELRRWTACEVFNYIASTIVMPASTPDIYFEVSETDGTGALGTGTPFHNLGLVNSPGMGAGFLQEHITTGIDPTPSPGLFDAKISIDFGVRISNGMNTPINSDAFDEDPTHGLYLYTIILHEATHCLGFYSSIESDGTSKLSLSSPGYYSLFDQNLINAGGTNLITSNTFSGSVPNLTSNGVLYRKQPTPNSMDYSVYSPFMWAGGSSLSHFDNDRDGYTLIMNPSYSGVKKTWQKPEFEVLCNLGYTLTVPDFVCDDRYAVGVDDVVAGTNATTPISTDVILNDYDLDEGGPGQGIAVDPSSVMLLTNSGNVQVSGNNIIYTPDGNFCGNIVIRYRPYTISNGYMGSYATLTVTIPCPDFCLDDPCSLICNGSFELGLTVTQFDAIVAPQMWQNVSTSATSAQTGWMVVPNTNGFIGYNTPDYFFRGSTVQDANFPYPPMDIPLNGLANQPPGVETPTPGNNRYMGMGEGGATGSTYVQSESVYKSLIRPLVAGEFYRLTYSARAITTSMSSIVVPPGTPSAGPAYVNTSFSVTPPANNIGITFPPVAFTGTNFTSSQIAVVDCTSPSNQWTDITVDFQAQQNSQFITIEPAYVNNDPTYNTKPYIFIDNIRLVRMGDVQVSVTTTASPALVNVGQNVDFTINVCNTGTSTVTNVAVMNNLPPGFTFVSSPFFTATSNTYTIPSIAPGACVLLSVSGRPDYGNVALNTDLSDCAMITSQNSCLQTQGCATVRVLASNINITTSQPSCNANGCTVFRVTVSNTGSITANNVKVKCVPAACAGYVPGTFTSLPAGAATLITPANTYLISSIAPGTSVMISFPVCPANPANCSASNTAAFISMDEYDTILDDNFGSIVLAGCACINLIRMH